MTKMTRRDRNKDSLFPRVAFTSTLFFSLITGSMVCRSAFCWAFTATPTVPIVTRLSGSARRYGSIVSLEKYHIRQKPQRTIQMSEAPHHNYLDSPDHLWETLNHWYSRASNIRCPFFRRRASDIIDSTALIMRFLLIRHKSILPSDMWCPPGCLSIDTRRGEDGSVLQKMRNLPIEKVVEEIRTDWQGTPLMATQTSIGNTRNDKGYYITGKLNSLIYRDDCLFDGPDPDMPVRGLRKYLGAASHLFDQRQSFAQLLDMSVCEATRTVTARWRIGGVLMLPWRPVVKPWTGTTKYHLDEDGLIYLHEEEWDISVLEAFVCTVLPEVGERIWGGSVAKDGASGNQLV